MKSVHRVFVVVDVNGKGYSVRHGQKATPSVYEHHHNAEYFVKRVHKEKKRELFVFPAHIIYEADK